MPCQLLRGVLHVQERAFESNLEFLRISWVSKGCWAPEYLLRSYHVVLIAPCELVEVNQEWVHHEWPEIRIVVWGHIENVAEDLQNLHDRNLFNK